MSERESVLHSWCVPAQWDAPTIVGGAGAWIFTAEGGRVLDMSSLAECSNLGHQHPRIVRAIRAQAEKLCFVTAAWGAEPRARLAEMLLERSGFEGGRVFFTLGGADANENAVKFARWAGGKPFGKIVTRHRSYHGATHAALALSGDARSANQDLLGLAGVVHALPPYAYRCPFHSPDAETCGRRAAEHLGALIDAEGPEAVAAVLMEPNAGTNGIVPPDSYWPALREETRQRGVWLIADEVMSGFGRCGEWFAWQRYGEPGRPDLMTLAKGLTGAHLPLGAVVLGQAVAGALQDQWLATGLTYCGHPLSCAAGVAALESYAEEGLIERSRLMGPRLLAELEGLKTRYKVIGDVRGGHGLFAVIELVANRETRAPLAPWPELPEALRALLKEALGQGVSFAARGNLIILAPPLVISDSELGQAIGLLDRLLAVHFPNESPTP